MERVTLDYNNAINKAIITIVGEDKEVHAFALDPKDVEALDKDIQKLKAPQPQTNFNVFNPKSQLGQKKKQETSTITISSELFQAFKELQLNNSRLREENDILKRELQRYKGAK